MKRDESRDQVVVPHVRQLPRGFVWYKRTAAGAPAAAGAAGTQQEAAVEGLERSAVEESVLLMKAGCGLQVAGCRLQ